mgnify:CR=1 FL=1
MLTSYHFFAGSIIAASSQIKSELYTYQFVPVIGIGNNDYRDKPLYSSYLTRPHLSFLVSLRVIFNSISDHHVYIQ